MPGGRAPPCSAADPGARLGARCRGRPTFPQARWPHPNHPLSSLSLSGANFQIEVLPQGKAWQDVPGVQGDPRSCIVVPSGLATPLLVLEGDDPPHSLNQYVLSSFLFL